MKYTKYWILSIFAILVTLFLIFLGMHYYLARDNYQSIELFQQFDKALIIKTHVWNKQIASFVRKLMTETLSSQTDFYLLIHDENGQLMKQIEDQDIKTRTVSFTEKTIKKVYSKGFYSMWLCNHWILMWFFKNFHHKYQYYWSIEYDVRISGDSSRIWNYHGTEDFIYPINPFQDPNWTWKNHYIGPMNDNEKWYGYLQLTRYSKKFLEYLDHYFSLGENGQDEMMMFSLFKRGENAGELTGSNQLLHPLIQDSWSVDNRDNDKHLKIYDESEKKYDDDPDHLIIIHPAKFN